MKVNLDGKEEWAEKGTPLEGRPFYRTQSTSITQNTFTFASRNSRSWKAFRRGLSMANELVDEKNNGRACSTRTGRDAEPKDCV
jgi:hypothetical protein